MGTGGSKSVVSTTASTKTPSSEPAAPRLVDLCKSDLVAPDQRPPLTYTVASEFIGTHSSPGDQLHQKLRKSLDAFRQQLSPQVAKCWASFKVLQERYTASMGGDAERSALMTPDSANFVQKASVSEPARTAFFGLTGVGKSQLINSLLKDQDREGRLLPTGGAYTTARICWLKYAPLALARIYTVKIVTGAFVQGPTLEDLSGCPTLSSVSQRLKAHISRQSMPEGEVEKMAWLTTAIVVEYPVDLLSSGLEAVDLAGAASNDEYWPTIFPFITGFLSIYRPHGIVFCFRTGAFEEGEKFAFSVLEKLLAGLQYRNGDLPDFFFANTCVDHDIIRSDLNIADDDPLSLQDVEKYNQTRLDLLRKTAPILLDLPATFQQCTSFCCVSAKDFLFRSDENATELTYGLFMNRFVHWVVAGQQRRCLQALEQISSACRCFYNNLHTVQACTKELISRKAEELDILLLKQKESLKVDITNRLQSFSERLTTRLRAVEKDCLSHAAHMSTPFDNATLLRCQVEAEAAVIKNLTHWVQENVTQPVVKHIDSEIKASVEESTKQFRNLEDDIMRDFFRQAQHRFSLSPVKVLATGASLTCAAVLSCALLAVFFCGPVLVAGVLTTCISGVYYSTKHVDEEFKRKVAKEMLGSLSNTFDSGPWLKENLNRVEQLFEGYRKAVKHQAAQQITMHINYFRGSNVNQWWELRHAFGLLIADTLLTKNSFCCVTPPHVDFSPEFQIGKGGCSAVYKAEWHGQSVAIKVMDPEVSIDDDQRVFFEEVFNSTTLAVNPSSNVLQFLLLFKQDNKWCLMYPLLTCSLRDYLEKHISELSLARMLSIAKSMIIGIKNIHNCSLIHRDIKLENILVRTEEERVTDVVVADFGFSVVDPICCPVLRTNVGTLGYYAPEIVAHKPYNNSIDIFAFGIILAEMTPKPELIRTRVNDRGWEIHSLIAPSTPPQVVELISKCVAIEPEQRPTACMVQKQIENLETQNLGAL